LLHELIIIEQIVVWNWHAHEMGANIEIRYAGKTFYCFKPLIAENLKYILTGMRGRELTMEFQ